MTDVIAAELADRQLRVGMDVGGTKIDAVVISEGRVVSRIRRTTGWGDEQVLSSILETVAALAASGGFDARRVDSVGIGIPGHVDAETGRVLHAVNLGIESLDLADRVSRRLGVPVRAENDVKAAALGASVLSGSTGSMAYLNLGTGVAAGIVVDGAIWRGSRGIAGEVGHLSVDPNGRLCGCGQRGCIETLAGGGALAKVWGRSDPFPVLAILDAAEHGHVDAVHLRADLFRGAAAAVRALVLAADVEQVIIGGGLTALGQRLHDGIQSELREGAARSPFMSSLQLDTRFELLPPESPVAAFGAALVASPPASTKETVTHG